MNENRKKTTKNTVKTLVTTEKTATAAPKSIYAPKTTILSTSHNVYYAT